ncbi:lipid IV(A) 3-deoxy-D-manno-octulosonic acid transferase [Thiomicrorhabdus sp. 6S3-12]|uniref:lipid IV(A) 3-deoxy-D-manno-octulosonic acid transferase n=1 Tax=Thiomicrorhabdus sp. 6S3-12 TaxID=2819681 RepID=UPI001AAC4D05|nr:lipid IV(A) 3-deoxy-D-manno-octulosonic acid transferase [Thiomicrorhabdus sp. 6S3-12]MBO1923115.1 lipid IV(A) 3-deoxy-D-manno-octulosonic acid transferase [Thiomicrorhabdus sp. 6S3-12]
MRNLLYLLLTHLALPAVAWISWRKCLRAKKDNPLLPDCFADKFGYIHPQKRHGIVIHAVSLGETRSVLPLISALQEQHPDLPITLTNGSVRGAKQLAGTLPEGVEHHFLPLDYPFAVKRFLHALQPKLVVVVETEIWPNLIRTCEKRNIPIVLANARLKASSMHSYRKFGGTWLQTRLQAFKWIGCQFAADKQHFLELGVPADKLKIHGNLKFDLNLDPQLAHKASEWKRQFASTAEERFIWVAASTHEGEEALMLEAHRALQAQHPNALLILVPRQADRFTEVEQLLQQQQCNYATRSSKALIQKQTEILLADSVGEMMLWFELADVAFIGGSLVPFGGHNILEPAAVGTPVISGKWHHNLQTLYDAIKQDNGVIIVASAEELAQQLCLFADAPDQRQQQGLRGYQAFRKHSGALHNLLQDIEQTLRNR